MIGQLSVGGAEGQLRELIRGMDRSRFEPMVYSLAEGTGRLQPALEAAGATVRVVGSKGLTRARRLAKALRGDGAGLVHSWLFIANTYAWLARGLGARLPLVTSARNCKSQGWLHHLANTAAFRASSRIVTNSEQVRQYIVRHYAAPADRIRMIHNGVDTVRFQPAGRPADHQPTVITIGRLVAQKNPLLFVEAAARVRQQLPGARFVMVGDGPLRPTVESRVRALGLTERFDLVGERTDIESFYAAADVFWLTSSWEGLPNVILEAMACGLPVVTTDVGGVRELLRTGEEGYVVPVNDAEAVAAAGLRLLRDAALCRAMGAAARRTAETFSLTRMVAATEALYAECLQGAAVRVGCARRHRGSTHLA